MSANPWYPFYPGDYLAKTRGLSLMEHGAYLLLLSEYYSTRQPLAKEMAVLYRVCNAFNHRERNAVRYVIDKFFVPSDDGFRHTRADAEIVNRDYNKHILSSRGKAGSDARWGKNSDASSIAKANASGIACSQPQSYSKTLSTLSGKPDVLPVDKKPKKNFNTEAIEVLTFLNEKTGRHYRPTDSNLKMIQARLREGATVADCRQVIAKKVREWATNEKMRDYLRPATLFNAMKFSQYSGELVKLEPEPDYYEGPIPF